MILLVKWRVLATQWVNQTICPCNLLNLKLAMRQDTPYFIILLCLIPNDFTRKRESARTQWDKPTFTVS